MIRAVYPGSFDPITNGHIYISERAAALFDELIVAVLVNPEKRSTFSEEERQIMAREALVHLPNVKVKYFNGLLVDFMRQQQSRIIIRGLRALSDFEYEGATVMMAPASGFYVTPGLGRSQVRMAYVLNADDLRSAVSVLSAAISAYRCLNRL